MGHGAGEEIIAQGKFDCPSFTRPEGQAEVAKNFVLQGDDMSGDGFAVLLQGFADIYHGNLTMLIGHLNLAAFLSAKIP
jgi:hypothetical protein